MILKFKYLLPLLLVAAAFGQSGQRSGQALLKGGENFAIIAPSASVYVCVYNSQLACSTQVATWSDPALTVPVSQPIIADVNGVYSYYLPSSQRVVEKVCSIQNQCSSYAVSIPYGASGSSGAVLAVFGRYGAVVAGTGDYSFSQISSTLLHSQLPTLLSGDIPNNISTAAQLTSALAACGSATCSLTIIGNIAIASNLSIPSNVSLTFSGGQLLPGSGATVTILGKITDTSSQIFGGVGSIAGLTLDRPEWFGTGATCVSGACPSIKTAISALGSNGGTVRLGYAFYRSGYEAGTNLTLPNITVQGVQEPAFNTATPTALVNGSIIQGTFGVAAGANNLTISGVGFDTGSAFVSSQYGGTSSDAFSIYVPGQTTGTTPISNVNISNAACLVSSASALFHCFLAENVVNSTFRDISGFYGVHGMIIKGVHDTADGLYFHGHNYDCLIVKSDDYAPTSNITVSNMHCNSVIAGDTGGVILQAETASLANVSLSNFAIQGANFGVSTIVSASGVSRISVANGTVDYGGLSSAPSSQMCIGDSGTGTYNYSSFTNIDCNNYQYATYFPTRMDASMISNLTSNNSAQGIWLNGSNTVISNVFEEADTGFNSSLVTSSVGGSSISVQNLTEYGAYGYLSIVSNGAHIAFGDLLDGTGLFLQQTVEVGSPYTVRGGTGATYDFTVQDATGVYNNWLVTDAGIGHLRGDMWANSYLVQGHIAIPATAGGYLGPATGYVQLAPAPSGAGCLYQNGASTYSWAACGGVTPLATPASAITISLPHGYGVCTGTCTVTLPAPTTAGDDFCLWNDVGVSTAITISGHTGVFFSQTDLSAYGTTGGTFTATAAAGNKVCMVARDTTHWIPLSYAGTWTAN